MCGCWPRPSLSAMPLRWLTALARGCHCGQCSRSRKAGRRSCTDRGVLGVSGSRSRSTPRRSRRGGGGWPPGAGRVEVDLLGDGAGGEVAVAADLLIVPPHCVSARLETVGEHRSDLVAVVVAAGRDRPRRCRAAPVRGWRGRRRVLSHAATAGRRAGVAAARRRAGSTPDSAQHVGHAAGAPPSPATARARRVRTLRARLLGSAVAPSPCPGSPAGSVPAE